MPTKQFNIRNNNTVLILSSTNSHGNECEKILQCGYQNKIDTFWQSKMFNVQINATLIINNRHLRLITRATCFFLNCFIQIAVRTDISGRTVNKHVTQNVKHAQILVCALPVLMGNMEISVKTAAMNVVRLATMSSIV